MSAHTGALLSSRRQGMVSVGDCSSTRQTALKSQFYPPEAVHADKSLGLTSPQASCSKISRGAAQHMCIATHVKPHQVDAASNPHPTACLQQNMAQQ
jgi:hypothetical protein